jgi:hypothetical protein
MRSGTWVLLFVALACRGGSPEAVAASPDTRSSPPPAPPAASAPARSETYYDASELKALAAQVKPVKKDGLLVCGEAGRNCVCLEPLPCKAKGNCVAFQENIDAFRKALATKTPGRSVECRRAEIGQCGAFRYFDFEGDISRREMRWFDGAGNLVAQRSSTDYEEYCGGKSRTRFQGKVPRCDAIKRTELICGSAEGDLPLPIEDVLKRRLKPSDAEKR